MIIINNNNDNDNDNNNDNNNNNYNNKKLFKYLVALSSNNDENTQVLVPSNIYEALYTSTINRFNKYYISNTVTHTLIGNTCYGICHQSPIRFINFKI